MKYLLVMIGGMLGALSRFGLSELFYYFNLSEPLAIMAANLIGSFSLAFLTIICLQSFHFNTEIKLLFGTGLFGSFTTFSTFAALTEAMLLDNLFFTAFLYMFTTVLIGILMAFLGMRSANYFVKRAEAN